MRNLFQSGWEFCPCLLKDGTVEEREVRFYADGSCVTWWEERHPDGLGYYEQCSDTDMDENPENWDWEAYGEQNVIKVLKIPKDISFDLAYIPDASDYYED